jgi:osmotically-inducible protein OsmY
MQQERNLNMTNIINEKAEKVRRAIISHEAFNSNWEINILEAGSVITLTGSVPSKEDVNLIESIAMNQDGVLSVNNELSIDEALHKIQSDDIDVDPDIHQIRIIAQQR